MTMDFQSSGIHPAPLDDKFKKPASMRSWANVEYDQKTPRLVVQEGLRAENARLKSELKRVEEERDILKKAAAYFAKASG